MHNTRVKDLIDELINECSYEKYIFRGINQIYKGEKTVSSSLFTKGDSDKTKKNSFSLQHAEREIIEKTRRFFPPNTSNIEILTDLRHYEGKVNLIDFTRDLYVALFFACHGKFTREGQLILLRIDNLDILTDIDYKNNEHKIALIEPAQTLTSKNRVIAQKSIFIYPSEGYIPKNQCTIKTINHRYKKDILEYLKKFHDIYFDTIYNDLIGFIKNELNCNS